MTDNTARSGDLPLSQAIEAYEVHRVTLQRRLKRGDFPNARRDKRGWWHIPVTDLEAAGLKPRRSRSRPQEEAELLERENIEFRRRLAVAEAVAQERLDRIADMREALRLLQSLSGKEVSGT